jgi:(E)-4-hydroxy-3-methylbut-2-enyl-diphosphate synthase
MCNTRTDDVAATVAQIHRLEAAGCDIIRVAVPDQAAARAVGAIKEQIHIPLVVDIHFDYRLALESVAAGCDKVRINPGNIGDAERVKAVARACREKGVPSGLGSTAGPWKSRCWPGTAG